MGKKPNLAAAFEQAETDAAHNADLLTRLHQQKHKSLVEGSANQEHSQTQQPATSRFSIEQQPTNAEDQLTVSLSTRVPKSLRQRLKRLSLYREEHRQHPWGIQHMVTQALTEWLDRNRQQ
jgi:hypothetical protein